MLTVDLIVIYSIAIDVSLFIIICHSFYIVKETLIVFKTRCVDNCK